MAVIKNLKAVKIDQDHFLYTNTRKSIKIVTFDTKITFGAQSALWAPSCHFGPKEHFRLPKCIFTDLGPKSLHLAFVLIGFGAKRKKCAFCVKFPKMENSAKSFSAKRKIPQFSENFHGNRIFDTSDFTTALQKQL